MKRQPKGAPGRRRGSCCGRRRSRDAPESASGSSRPASPTGRGELRRGRPLLARAALRRRLRRRLRARPPPAPDAAARRLASASRCSRIAAALIVTGARLVVTEELEEPLPADEYPEEQDAIAADRRAERQPHHAQPAARALRRSVGRRRSRAGAAYAARLARPGVRHASFCARPGDAAGASSTRTAAASAPPTSSRMTSTPPSPKAPTRSISPPGRHRPASPRRPSNT